MSPKHALKLKILDDRMGKSIPLPDYQTVASAAVDLRACPKEDELILDPQKTLLVPTGMAVFIEDATLVGLIFPRSGLAHKHGIGLTNSVGVIDADYQGPLMVSMVNRSSVPFSIKPGDRIAQFALMPIVRFGFDVVKDFDATQRSEGGFGHTGVD